MLLFTPNKLKLYGYVYFRLQIPMWKMVIFTGNITREHFNGKIPIDTLSRIYVFEEKIRSNNFVHKHTLTTLEREQYCACLVLISL